MEIKTRIMKPIIDLDDLMTEQLRAMYDSEIQLRTTLPKILKSAGDENLKELISICLNEEETQVSRLKQVFEIIFKHEKGEKCKAMKVMLKEAKQLVKRSMDQEVMDAGIITALQHIIHYQIASYGALSNYANLLNLTDVAGMTHLNLEEKKAMDRKLAILADERINLKAKQVAR